LITDEWRASLSAAVQGKTIQSLEWSAEADGSDGYWVMTFTDGSEVCFARTMAELAIEAGLVSDSTRLQGVQEKPR